MKYQHILDLRVFESRKSDYEPVQSLFMAERHGESLTKYPDSTD